MTIPMPPLTGKRELAVTAEDIAKEMEPQILAGCVVCNRSSVWWWRGVALHAACAPRLVAQWQTQIADGTAFEPRLTNVVELGAYAAKRSTPRGQLQRAARAT